MLKKLYQYIQRCSDWMYMVQVEHYAEKGSAVNQYEAAVKFYTKEKYKDLIKAYAWASAAAFQKRHRISSAAAILRDEIFEKIEPEKRTHAQNLARKYRNRDFSF